jgi:hypothetical protein
MRGNRVTRKSGLVRAFRFFYLWGVDRWGWGCFFCFNRSHTRFVPPRQLRTVHVSLFYFPSSQQCLMARNLVSLCVFAHLPNLCVVCHIVNVYLALPQIFAHHVNPPFICDSFRCPLDQASGSFLCWLLFHERNGQSSLPIYGGRHSRSFHVPLCRHCVTVYTTGATCDRLHGRCESGGMLDLIFPWVNSTNASPEATWNSSVPP